MTDQEANVAVAELCGWELEGSATPTPSGKPVFTGWWRSPSGFTADEPPDYGNDLNAMHEAEDNLLAIPVFGDNKYELTYKRFLEGTSSYTRPFYRATAAQRREAFLRVVGKWKE